MPIHTIVLKGINLERDGITVVDNVHLGRKENISSLNLPSIWSSIGIRRVTSLYLEYRTFDYFMEACLEASVP